MNSLFRLYWRQAMLFILLALPIAGFAIIGLVWIILSGWFVYVLIGMALLGIAVVLLGRSIRRAGNELSYISTPADSGWAPSECLTWKQVQIIAERFQESPPRTLDDVHKMAEHVVQTVAQHLHGKSDFAWAKFTLPEILCAIEHASQNLRHAVRTRIPGSESISVANILVVYDFYVKQRSKALFAWYAYRVWRGMSNPYTAVVQEISGLSQGAALNSTSTMVQGWMARLLIEELGRSAINLYAGRYRLSEAESKQSITEAAPQPTASIPIRILIAGQVNAGKSSLTNALLGAIKSPISELPTPGPIREFRINPDERLDLVVLDSPGLAASSNNLQTVLDQCAGIDLIIWVVQANNPARDLDVGALAEIRKRIHSNPRLRPPSMMLVMTHIDRINPAKEWAPPYDLDQTENAKAANIRRAMVHVTEALGFGDDLSIPVSLREGAPIYNLDAIWSAIGVLLNAAQLTALDRELKQGGSFSLPKTFAQCREGGRFIVGKVWGNLSGADRRGPIG